MNSKPTSETFFAVTPTFIKGKSRAWLLYQIMKDADALDRVRFGTFALDVNFLRLPISHKLVPLAEVATATVGPTATDTTTVTTTDKAGKTNALIEFCAVARSRAEMMELMELANANHFRKEYLNPLLKSGILVRTIPDKPNSRNQKYVKASKP